jgi:hypothetical protein
MFRIGLSVISPSSTRKFEVHAKRLVARRRGRGFVRFEERGEVRLDVLALDRGGLGWHPRVDQEVDELVRCQDVFLDSRVGAVGGPQRPFVETQIRRQFADRLRTGRYPHARHNRLRPVATSALCERNAGRGSGGGWSKVLVRWHFRKGA